MFSRKKRKEQLPSFIEGTQGRYVRRASPPPVPSLTTHSIPPKKTQPTNSESSGSNTVPGSSSAGPSSAKTSFSHTSINAMDTDPGSRRPSTSSYISGDPQYVVSYQPQPSTSGYPYDPRHRLLQQQHLELDNGKRSPQPGALSSHSFSDPRREHHRKPLTSSHSIGNVESYMDQYVNDYGEPTDQQQQQQRFVSLQSLPGRGQNLGSSIIGDDNLIPQDDLPLPANWAIEVTPEGLRYYVDHNTRRTHWIHPLAHENLPPGWRKIFNEQTGVLYYNEVEGRSQLEHPGLAAPINRTESMLVASRKAESAIENLNIIHQEEIPEWLMMYSQADAGLDHLLEWNLFSTLQLEQFERMMRKLYKQEVIDTVRRYERMRTVLNKEIYRRTQPRPQPENYVHFTSGE